MLFFTPDFKAFFEELAQNNQKDWFEANRQRYETQVRDPFRTFVTELLIEVQNLDATIRTEAKNCIFRINRDIRFSKDKTPYKLHTSAVIGREGKKSAEIAGFYFEFSAQGLTFATGAYQPDKEYLTKIRREIQANKQEFREIIENSDFKTAYGNLQGEKNKIIPQEFQADLSDEPLLANKAFYGMVSYPEVDRLFRPDLLDFVLKHYFVALPLTRFLLRAYDY